MSGNSILLDTNIILYFLSGDQTLLEILEDKRIYISFITELELLSYSKLSDSDSSLIKLFLEECIIIDINPEIKKHTIKIRKEYGLKLPDSIISASSIYLNIPLLTADKGFQKAQLLNLIIYEK